MNIEDIQEESSNSNKGEYVYIWSWLEDVEAARLAPDGKSKNDIERKDIVYYTKGEQIPENSSGLVNALRVGAYGRRQEVSEKEESESSEVSRNDKLAADMQEYDCKEQAGSKKKMYQNPEVFKNVVFNEMALNLEYKMWEKNQEASTEQQGYKSNRVSRGYNHNKEPCELKCEQMEEVKKEDFGEGQLNFSDKSDE